MSDYFYSLEMIILKRNYYSFGLPTGGSIMWLSELADLVARVADEENQ